MQQAPETYHIIGGGIAGLACAWFLKQKNPMVRSVIYESAQHLGGRAYSTFDEGTGLFLDNAVHAVLGANKFLARFVKKDEWKTTKYFIDMANDKLSSSLVSNYADLLKAFCNMPADEIAPVIKRKILLGLFPFTKGKRRVWFSQTNISQRIINVLAGSADEVHLGCRLQKIKTQFGTAAQLDFGKEQVDIGAKDKVIVALDNISCARILNVALLEHSPITNIIYHTSQTIFLPKAATFIGVKGGLSDWIFSGSNLVSAVVSAEASGKELSDLAIKIWRELDKIRGVNSGFVPSYKAVCCKNAVIKQNKANNNLRPTSARTDYPNVFIAGDWTLKNQPCCMETAVKSALRAVKTALKSV